MVAIKNYMCIYNFQNFLTGCLSSIHFILCKFTTQKYLEVHIQNSLKITAHVLSHLKIQNPTNCLSCSTRPITELFSYTILPIQGCTLDNKKE